jgi:Mrp family chromosome partitioning ATPase
MDGSIYSPAHDERGVGTGIETLPLAGKDGSRRIELDAAAPDIERIFLSAAARGARVLGVVGCGPGDAHHLLARALAERSARSGEATLLLDLSRPVGPATDRIRWAPGDERVGESIQRDPRGFERLTAVACPTTVMRFRNLGGLKHLLEQELAHYHAIVIDAGSLLGGEESAIPAATIAQACETIVMATIPGAMRRDQFTAAVTTLGPAASRMVGLVLDDAGNPTVGEDLCRLAARLDRYLPAVSRRLIRWLSQRPLLWDRA